MDEQTETSGSGLTQAPGRIGKNRERETTPADTDVSTTRSVWMLVRIGASTPASFVCPHTRDSKNED